jgi:hypothetical protein
VISISAPLGGSTPPLAYGSVKFVHEIGPPAANKRSLHFHPVGIRTDAPRPSIRVGAG